MIAPVQLPAPVVDSEHVAPPLSEALISLGNLRHNIRQVRHLVGKERRIMAIVKANAYSHGIDLVAPAMLEEGVRDFGVANIHEAVHLRELLGDSPVQILAFASPLFRSWNFTLSTRLRFVLAILKPCALPKPSPKNSANRLMCI
jgi:alanine racemase